MQTHQHKHAFESDRFIGQTGEDVSVLTFRGGGFDTVMYLGVVQAWLLMNRPAPTLVTGVSAGGIAAAAAAEVFQAGKGCQDRRREQARRLRELVRGYAEAPRELLRAWIPDTYEIHADRPLESLKLPIQFSKERDDRQRAVLSKFGLIKLFNAILAIDLKISVITRIVRNVLELIALEEEPSRTKRILGRLRAGAAIWLLGCLHPVSCGVLLSTILRAVINRKPGRYDASAGEMLSIARRALARTFALGKRVVAFGAFLGLWVAPPFALLLAPAGAKYDWSWLAWSMLGADVALATFAIVLAYRFCNDELIDRILERYDLKAELASSYDLKQFLIRQFDPEYYGHLDLSAAIDRGLARSRGTQADNGVSRKTLATYAAASPSIWVAPAAADLGTGELRLLGSAAPVVDALMASMAKTPFFQARTLETGSPNDQRHTFIDGVKVANEPISAVMDHLRHHLRPDVKSVTIYPVAPFPSTGEPSRSEFTDLVDVVQRVLAIERVQSANLERTVSNVYSKILPDTAAVTPLGPDLDPASTFVKAKIRPISPDVPLALNHKLLNARNQSDRARMMCRAIATGCRAALSEELKEELTQESKSSGLQVIQCQTVLKRHWDDKCSGDKFQLAGSSALLGPGLVEVCAQCEVVAGVNTHHGSLLVPAEPPAPTPVRRQDGPTTPWVTMALSGGVFRGVFQLGVLNALSELGVQPRLIAGSSVGSIMAALGARLSTKRTLVDRQQIIRETAATFLTLDLIIPTDRFSDFIRRFTLRGGAAEFSARDADLLFRRYDVGARSFSRSARRVIAGLERLLYVTPFETKAITEALREEDFEKALTIVKRCAQDFLERSGIGIEMLGAEPLKLLIDRFVFGGTDDGDNATLRYFKGVHLIVTATNLNQGELKVFGHGAAEGSNDPEPDSVRLLEALLASSAFPAVFRPRGEAELTPYGSSEAKLVDGGVTDNLPLDAVAKFLARASDRALTVRRPLTAAGQHIPHLLLTASLEPKWSRLSDQDAETRGESWRAVRQRAAQIRYNRKSDAFAKSQRDIRNIWESGKVKPDWMPLDLEVVTIKPDWLCSTFGFHPMLGFRRSLQAASIAHGCAATFAKLAHLSEMAPPMADGSPRWGANDYGIDVSDVIQTAVEWNPTHTGEPWTREPILSPLKEVGDEPDVDPTLPGRCWFRRKAICPFYLESNGDGSGADTKRRIELRAIYMACGDWRTHRPPDERE
jgi:predicted acylesterase/phospholipase RssA